MALCDGGDSGYEASFYTSQLQDRGNFLTEYGVAQSHMFNCLNTFKQDCMAFYAEMEEGNMEGEVQYLGFTNVSMNDVDGIDDNRSDLPTMRVFYEMNQEILIVKFMVGTTHEICGCLLNRVVDRVVENRTGLGWSIISVGSARFRGLHRIKEANHGWKPASRTLEGDWPSVVIEVGVFERFSQLHKDAQFWLECSRGQTRVVILASINKQARSWMIERWQQDPVASRLQPAQNMGVPNPSAWNHVPVCMQSLSLQEGQAYIGASLIIPAVLIYDVLPPIQGVGFGSNDFEITPQMLNNLNETVWRALM